MAAEHYLSLDDILEDARSGRAVDLNGQVHPAGEYGWRSEPAGNPYLPDFADDTLSDDNDQDDTGEEDFLSELPQDEDSKESL